MIARGWWPLQRSLAAHPVLAIAIASAPLVALGVWWRPPATLWPAALASMVAVLAPVVIARGDGSRRRLSGRATGAAMVIAQPLVLAALFVDVRLLVPIAAAAALAVLVPAIVPVREEAMGSELPPEPRPTVVSWLVPLVALVALVGVLVARSGHRIAVPELDLREVATLIGCAAIWIGLSARPLLGIAIAAATFAALAVAASSTPVTPITIALALTTPLVAWFQRQSSGGFPAWAPAAIAVATVSAYAQDPAWHVMATVTLATWLVSALYPAHAASGATTDRSATGIIAWAQRLFSGLEPYWRFYGRAKLAQDPIYARLAGEPRTWGSVLDAGCGPGLTAVVAAGRADTTAYLGIDLDLDKLLVARRALHLSGRTIGSGATWRLRRDSFPILRPPPDRFDTILLLDVLHYWPDDVQARTLEQLASLLQPTGRLYLREAVAAIGGDAGHIERGERFTTYFGLNPETPLTFLTAARIAGVIAGAGLVVELEEPMGAENRLWICRR